MRFNTEKNKEVVTAQILSDIEELTKHPEKVTVIASQPEQVSQIKKLVKEYPEECEVVEVTKTIEGETIRVHIPVAWVEISPEE